MTLTKVLARELHRRRCRDLASQGSGPVRAGRAIGRLTAQLLASRATGSAGTLPVAAAVATEAGDAVAATDAAGAPLPPDDDGTPSLAMPVAPGNATALGCVILARFPTQACAPFGGTVALTGAIVLRLGSRATTSRTWRSPTPRTPAATASRRARSAPRSTARRSPSPPPRRASRAWTPRPAALAAARRCPRRAGRRRPVPGRAVVHDGGSSLIARAARSVRSIRSLICVAAAVSSSARSAAGQNQR